MFQQPEANIWRPSLLTKVLHEVPHLDLGLNPVSDIFDWGSTDYKMSLIMLASIPTVLTIISLLVFLAWKVGTKGPWPLEKCPCKIKEVMQIMCAVCAVLMLLVLLIELAVIHNRAMTVISQPLYVEQDILNYYKFIDSFKLDEGNITLKNLMDYKDTAVNMSYMWPIKIQIGTFMNLCQTTMAYKLRLPQSTRVEIKSDAKDVFLKKEWKRFNIFVMCWIFGILIAVVSFLYAFKFWHCAVVAVVFNCIVTGLMIFTIVAAADICIFPEIVFDAYVNFDNKKSQMEEAYDFICGKLDAEYKNNKPIFKALHKDWQIFFKQKLKDIESEYTVTNTSRATDMRIKVLQDVDKKYFEFALTEKELEARPLNYTIECVNTTEFKDQDIPDEDFRPLCSLIEWMFLQLLLLLVVLVLSIMVLMLRGYRINSFAYYKKMFILYKSGALKSELDPCVKPICDQSKLCDCLKPKKVDPYNEPPPPGEEVQMVQKVQRETHGDVMIDDDGSRQGTYKRK